MKRVFFVGFVFILSKLSLTAKPKPSEGCDKFIECAFYLSEVMLHDVVNPPAASRFYAYSLLGAYEIANRFGENMPELNGLFHAKPNFTHSKLPINLNREFCATFAMLEVARQIIPSGYLLEQRQRELIRFYRKKGRLLIKDVNENTLFATAVANQVINYAKKDGYFSLSTLPRYAANIKDEGHWYPTPPEYMAAVEPHWKSIRTFFLDSASQFSPPRPVPFSKETGSKFHALMLEVYQMGKNLSVEQKSIAAFWDCNPFAVNYSGHMAIGLKKISPGGHWMSITGIACRKAKTDFNKTVLAHTLVALTLHDSFVSCWEEKYKSDRIRPEDAINKFLDPKWRPLLQTPPFPEYTSGHSVISAACAEILSYLFGDNFQYVDTSEEYFGLPARSFHSFRDAANEAGLSRLYGGIHFRDAVDAGSQQGATIGLFIVGKVKRNSNQ